MKLLEGRLDNVVYRLGFSTSRPQARQLVTHGHIMVNGRKLDIPSAAVSIGAEVGFSPRGKRSEYVAILREEIGSRDVPEWLDLNRDNLVGRMVSDPGPGDYEPHFNPNAIVEYYSR